MENADFFNHYVYRQKIPWSTSGSSAKEHHQHCDFEFEGGNFVICFEQTHERLHY
jgi:hypothetical protein